MKPGPKGKVLFWSVTYVSPNMTGIPSYVQSSQSIASMVLGSKFPGEVFRGYRNDDWIELVDEPGYMKVQAVGQGILVVPRGIDAFWKLRCFAGFAPDAKIGDIATCSAPGLLQEPQPECVRDAGCSGTSLPVDVQVSADQTSCAQWMSEGGFCRTTCANSSVAMGLFQCSHGEMVGQSFCVSRKANAVPVTESHVAGTFQVMFTPEPAESALAKGLAAGLNVPEASVLKVQLTSLAGQRRLKGGRSLGADSFHVRYEINASDVDVGVLIAKANSLSEVNGTAQARFQQALMSVGVEASGIQSVIAPREVEGLLITDSNGTVITPNFSEPLRAGKELGKKQPVPQEDGGIDVALLLSIILGSLLVLCTCFCVVQYVKLMQRKANA
jgi:hypothetical protein